MSCKLKFQVLLQSFGPNLYPRGCLASKFPIPSLLKHDNFDWLRGPTRCFAIYPPPPLISQFLFRAAWMQFKRISPPTGFPGGRRAHWRGPTAPWRTLWPTSWVYPCLCLWQDNVPTVPSAWGSKTIPASAQHGHVNSIVNHARPMNFDTLDRCGCQCQCRCQH